MYVNTVTATNYSTTGMSAGRMVEMRRMHETWKEAMCVCVRETNTQRGSTETHSRVREKRRCIHHYLLHSPAVS